MKNKFQTYNAIAETNNFIVLDRYDKHTTANEPNLGYQTENALEQEFITDLQNQGYEYVPELTTQQTMLDNVRVQLQTLNNMTFSDKEWVRFVEEYLDKPSDNLIEKTRKNT